MHLLAKGWLTESLRDSNNKINQQQYVTVPLPQSHNKHALSLETRLRVFILFSEESIREDDIICLCNKMGFS